MSDVRLLVNGGQLDLKPGERIPYVKQVNNFQDLSSRQTNFARTFRAPMNEHNQALLDGLGILQSNSVLPYRKNKARLFVDSLALILDGWLNFKVVNGEYEIHIYDGNIDFFKALDNLIFDDIPLPEIDHTKSVQTILDNWDAFQNANAKFHYLLADYNGVRTYEDSNGEIRVNIDYLVPSVQVQYLLNSLFTHLGYSFDMLTSLRNLLGGLFITYPKGITTLTTGDSYFKLEFPDQSVNHQVNTPLQLHFTDYNYTETLTQGTIETHPTVPKARAWEVPFSGYYKITMQGALTPIGFANSPSVTISYEIETAQGSNGQTVQFVEVATVFDTIKTFDYEVIVYIEAGHQVSPFIQKAGGNSLYWYEPSNVQFNFEVTRVNPNNIDQTEFLKGLSCKDFYKEILWRFGLTTIPDRLESNIKIMTYAEILGNTPADWSEYFQSYSTEDFKVGAFAKENILSFKYNDEAEDFNNGTIRIDDDNLDDSKTIVQSKTYSRDRELTLFDLSPTESVEVPKVKLWDQEVKEDAGTAIVEFKALDGRFTFLTQRRDTRTIKIGSDESGQVGSSNGFERASASDDSFQRQVENYYKPIIPALNRARYFKARFIMPIAIFDAWTFDRSVYIEQLGGRYLVETLTRRDILDDETEATLIKVN